MRELVQYIATSLVDDPKQVKVSQVRQGSRQVVRLEVAKEDMGRIIGKNGKVANAIRIMLRVVAAQEGKQAFLDIVEPE